MRYLLLVYEDEQQWHMLPASERDALAQACWESDEALRASGYLLAVEAPHPSCTATHVRVQHTAVSVTVGPVIQAPEQLRAIVTISARDLNEAIQVATTMPQARVGPIEVRRLRECDRRGGGGS